MLTAQEKRTIEGLRKTDLNDLKNISLLLALTQNILKRNDDTNIDYCMKLTAFVKDKCKAIIPNVEPYVAEEYAKQYWFAVKIESRYKFESFIEFMEKNRPYEKKFYAPRRRTLKQVADELQNLEDGKYKFLGISMPSRTGKLIADETPVLTKDGWKTHGELKVGDYVVGRNGEWVKVTYVHPKHVANKRVWFADHTYIDCHENHEWVVFDRVRNCERIVETKDLAKSEYLENGHTRFRYFLPKIGPAEGTEKELLIDPYVLGAWLGDGTKTKPTVTICDTDTVILDEIKKHYDVTTCFEQVGCKAYSFDGLRQDLQKVNMCKSRESIAKRIPGMYFTASKQQRLKLLAGIIDTDGCLRANENRYDISTSDEELKNDYVKLLNSFGWRICVVKNEPTVSTSGIAGQKPNYRIGFNPTEEIPCKVSRKQLNTFSKQKRTSIHRVEDIEPKPGNCITVEGGVYRVGESQKLTHNSTMCIFFLAWISCKRPNSHNAMGGHSGILAKSFYQELLNLILTEEYAFAELYDYMNPGYFKRGIPTSKSADTFTITLGSPDRFATVTCRGSDGTWTGAVDVSKDGYLYIDDLVRDREHSLSPQRMENTFQEYLNKMVDRKNEGARELMVGTLWNVMDPLERIRKQFEGNPDYKFLKIPALNEKDESNFDYDINGFSTQYYREMRERLDNAEWMAKYQQMPFVREGLLFPSDELRRFDGTLNFKKRGLIAVIDPAIGKGDNLSMPICAWDKDDPSKRYIIDWVYTKETTKFSVPKCVDKIIKHSIPEVHIERDGIGEVVYKELKDEIARRGVMCKIVPKHSSNKLDKENKIQGCSDYIKDNFYFLDDKTVNDNNEAEFLVTQEYRNALADTTFYTSTGKNKNDDAPDSLAQLSIIFHPLQENGIVEAAFNPFRRFMGGYYDIY